MDVNAIIDYGWPQGAEWVGGMSDLIPLAKHFCGEELGKVRCGKDFLAAEFQTKIVLITRSGYIAIDDKTRND